MPNRDEMGELVKAFNKMKHATEGYINTLKENNEMAELLHKEELEKIPLLNRWMKLLGCVFVQRDDVRASVRALNDATAIVEGGRSFVIFPEGTRYKGEEGGAGEFKAGAFRIAVKTSAPVVPVAVTGARALFESNGNRCRPGSVRIKIMSPIQTAGMSKAEQKQLPDAVHQSILAALK